MGSHDNDMTLLESLQKTADIFLPSGYMEVRILNTNRGTQSGYYNDIEKLHKDIRRFDGKYNVFFTLNPIIRDIEARSLNRLTEYAQITTTDADIERRHWILIDLDPARPSGISSSAEQLEAANLLSEEIKKYLSDNGFPQPVKALSGNGFHLLYRVNLPNNDESRTIVKSFLGALDTRFSTEFVKVDTSTFNASRITKLYGTVACKGDSIPDRPHRKSEIVSVPDVLDCVSAVQLQSVIDENIVEEKKAKRRVRTEQQSESENTTGIISEPGEAFVLETWLDYRQIKVAKKKKIPDGTCYTLEECPWNPEHRDLSAFIIQYSNGNIFARCHHDSCNQDGWKALWEKYEDNKPLPTAKRKSYSSKTDSPKESPADILVHYVEQLNHEVYLDERGDAYVRVPMGNHAIGYELKSSLYQQLINSLYYQLTKKGISEEQQNQAIRTLQAKAVNEGKQCKVYKRFQLHEGILYYYLADAENQVLSISQDEIQVCTNPPIRAIKSKSMMPQPMPLEGKDFRDLMRKHHHFASKEDEMLHDVTLITRLINSIEQPIAIYSGQKGSSKTTSMDMDKRCLDYSTRNVIDMPESIEDLAILLASEDVIIFDNVDGLNKRQANVFCQVVSGAVIVKRTKYTDKELTELLIKCTIYMNGINLLSDRSDFLDRCIFLNKGAMNIDKRRSKQEVMNEFEEDKPYIMHGMFTTLSKAMEIYQDVKININDRLLDYLKWGYAIAEVLGYGGEKFLEAYQSNRNGIHEELVANDEVGGVLLRFFKNRHSYKGDMTSLSAELVESMAEEGLPAGSVIKSSIHLSRRLNEIKDSLLNVGLEVVIGREKGKRFVSITKVGEVDELDKNQTVKKKSESLDSCKKSKKTKKGFNRILEILEKNNKDKNQDDFDAAYGDYDEDDE